MPNDLMTAEEVAFFEAVCASPDNDTPRLVYADWLDENGQPERAEFIRVQCMLARMEMSDARFDELKARETVLLRVPQDPSPFWRDHHYFSRPRPEWIDCIPGVPRLRAKDIGIYWRFRRGFVEVVWFGPPNAPKLAETVFRMGPLRGLKLSGSFANPVLIAEALSSPRLAQITFLDLSESGCGPDTLGALRQFRAITALNGLTSLCLREWGLGDAAVRLVADTPVLSRLQSLDLARNSFSADGLRALLESPWLSEVNRLNLSGRPPRYDIHTDTFGGMQPNIGTDGVVLLSECPASARLVHLDLRWNNIGAQGAQALAASAYLANLASLQLYDEEPGRLQDPPVLAISDADVLSLRQRFGERVRFDGNGWWV